MQLFRVDLVKPSSFLGLGRNLRFSSLLAIDFRGTLTSKKYTGEGGGGYITVSCTCILGTWLSLYHCMYDDIP